MNKNEKILSTDYGVGTVISLNENRVGVEFKIIGEKVLKYYNIDTLTNVNELSDLLKKEYTLSDVLRVEFIKNRMFLMIDDFSYEEEIFYPLCDIIDSEEIEDNQLVLDNGKVKLSSLLESQGLEKEHILYFIDLLINLDSVIYELDNVGNDSELIAKKREIENKLEGFLKEQE